LCINTERIGIKTKKTKQLVKFILKNKTALEKLIAAEERLE
jgi:hypothetical protein